MLSLVAAVSTWPLQLRKASSVSSERPIRSVAVEGIQRVCEKFQFAAISDAQEHPENIEVIEFAESTVCVGPGGSPGLIETEVQVAQGRR